jgi:hypothetical protein
MSRVEGSELLIRNQMHLSGACRPMTPRRDREPTGKPWSGPEACRLQPNDTNTLRRAKPPSLFRNNTHCAKTSPWPPQTPHLQSRVRSAPTTRSTTPLERPAQRATRASPRATMTLDRRFHLQMRPRKRRGESCYARSNTSLPCRPLLDTPSLSCTKSNSPFAPSHLTPTSS